MEATTWLLPCTAHTYNTVLQDPREALIVSLRREVEALQNENDHLRKALDINKSAGISSKSQKCFRRGLVIFFFIQLKFMRSGRKKIKNLRVKKNCIFKTVCPRIRLWE